VTKIALVVSDVDGTLVTPDKHLTEASVRAARSLAERQIAFTIVSSRPPIGIRMLVEPLGLRLPIGVYSGGASIGPNLEFLDQHFVPEAAARRAVAMLSGFSADVWLFTDLGWLLRDRNGDYVTREEESIQAGPRVVADFEPYFQKVFKIVGSSRDFAALAECEAAVKEALGDSAFVVRSQPYYLDITAPGLDKGTFVEALSQGLGIPLARVAVLGDMDNDLAMFRKAGMSIAMGNASDDVKREAKYVTASNQEDGFAKAIQKYVLGDAG
jgi:Cof subfamily protein (haloacid dehalogenase superfamily)